MTLASDRAGAYAYLAIYRFVEDIHMASYPHTPEETGGATYRHFMQCLNEIETLIGPEADRSILSDSIKLGIQMKSFEALRSYVEEGRAAYESGAMPAHDRLYYERFSAHWENAQDLRGGVSPQKLVAQRKAMNAESGALPSLPPLDCAP